MLRRLFLIVLSWTTLVLPVAVFAENTEPSPQTQKILDENSRCDVETLGVYGGGEPVQLLATWRPRIYNCNPGEYLKKTETVVECAVCPENFYCPGVTEYTYADSDFGKESCPEGYIFAAEGSSSSEDCYKSETVLCSEQIPYSEIRHAIGADYNFESVGCTQHWGKDVVCSDSSCKITRLYCESGYQPIYENGAWSCLGETVLCPAGTYLPMNATECAECEENNFCLGGQYLLDNNDHDQGMDACKDGLKSPKGAHSDLDCGKILRIDGEALYLHPDKRGPSLVVQDSTGKKWYANASLLEKYGPIPLNSGGTSKQLHVIINGKEYTVHTSVLE